MPRRTGYGMRGTALRNTDLSPEAVSVHNLIKWHRIFRDEYVTAEDLASEARLSIPEPSECLRALLSRPERKLVM